MTAVDRMQLERLRQTLDEREARIRELEADLSALRDAYGAAVQELQRLGAKSVPLTAAPESEPAREPLAEGREHLTVSGTFQSDKYPTAPAGKVPLSVRDPVAQPFLYQYAQAHRAAGKHGDREFSRDLIDALFTAGYTPPDATPPQRRDALEALDGILPELQFGRGTHVQWRDYLQQHPDGEKRNPECGDADFHAKMVKVYDQRIAAIEKARRALSEPAVPEAVESWKEWHRQLSDILGCEYLERTVTLEKAKELRDRALAQSEQGRVPTEPTAKMVQAGEHAMREWRGSFDHDPLVIKIWKAMRAAAPQPDTQDEGE